MTRNKKDIYGNNHILHKKEKISSLILYWELYYDYYLPVFTEEKDIVDCRNCWQREIYADFNKAKFWIDFLDSDGEISNNSVKKIGIRAKVENN
jgi:hypothetical protein